MPKKINVITIQQNQLLEIPNDNIEIEANEDNEESPVIVADNQELLKDSVEVVESQDAKQDLPETIVKVKTTRVKQDKVIPAPVVEEPIEISDVLNVKPDLPQREVTVMHLVNCEKCNRQMLKQTLNINIKNLVQVITLSNQKHQNNQK